MTPKKSVEELAALPISARVRYLVDRHGGNQTQFAKRHGFPREQVSRWTKNVIPNLESAERLAALDGYPPELFTGSSDQDWLAAALAEAEQQRVETLELVRQVVIRLESLAGDVAALRTEVAEVRPRKRRPA